MSNNKDVAVGWDEPVKDSEIEQFVTLKPGTYKFEVMYLQRGQKSKTDKLCACPTAKIHYKIFGDNDQGETKVIKDYFLNKKTLGFISAIFRAAGLREHGSEAPLPWNDLEGSTGMCRVGIHEYNDKDYNHIDGFIDAVAAPKAPVPAFTEGQF